MTKEHRVKMAMAIQKVMLTVDGMTLAKIKPYMDEIEAVALDIVEFEDVTSTKWDANGMSLAEISENLELCDFDAGWNCCYKDFWKVFNQIKKSDN